MLSCVCPFMHVMTVITVKIVNEPWPLETSLIFVHDTIFHHHLVWHQIRRVSNGCYGLSLSFPRLSRSLSYLILSSFLPPSLPPFSTKEIMKRDLVKPVKPLLLFIFSFDINNFTIIHLSNEYFVFSDNLRIPFFSWILRHLGGFFIKRKLDHSTGKDELYKCILQEVRIFAPHMSFNIKIFF